MVIIALICTHQCKDYFKVLEAFESLQILLMQIPMVLLQVISCLRKNIQRQANHFESIEKSFRDTTYIQFKWHEKMFILKNRIVFLLVNEIPITTFLNILILQLSGCRGCKGAKRKCIFSQLNIQIFKFLIIITISPFLCYAEY